MNITKEKLKIRCFLFGLIISAVSTWANRYGEVDLWSFYHQISMAVCATCVALLFRISTNVSYKFVGLYLSMGIIFIQFITIIFPFLNTHSFDLSLYTLVYTIVALLSSYIGGFIGEFILKDEFKRSV